MKGDFSRLTFDPAKQFSRVLLQQGRVQLDADWNEQASLLLHQIRILTRAVVGPYGGIGKAFQVAKGDKSLLTIAKGRYFVDGIPCDTDGSLAFTPPDSWKSPHDGSIQPVDGAYLVYLAVTERYITFVTDDDIREKALGDGVDTATRTKVVFSVNALRVGDDARAFTGEGREKAIATALAGLVPPEEGRPALAASVQSQGKPQDVCNVPPYSKYRGEGNQLYRVEIHDPSKNGKGATFKWSRENASVIFPVTKVAGNKVFISRFGKDPRFGVRKGDWVEFEDDDILASGNYHALASVQLVESDGVTLGSAPPAGFGADTGKHPILRRWDHGATPNAPGTVAIQEAKAYPLELGIQVEFQAGGNEYLHGDYWLIPARTLTGGLDWPAGQYLPARRVETGAAPLAVITVAAGKLTADPKDVRSVIQPIAQPVP